MLSVCLIVYWAVVVFVYWPYAALCACGSLGTLSAFLSKFVCLLVFYRTLCVLNVCLMVYCALVLLLFSCLLAYWLSAAQWACFLLVKLFIGHSSCISEQVCLFIGHLPLVPLDVPSSVVFACKTATFGPESQVSMGTRPHLSF